jgi:hypothetical protein
MYAWLPCSPGTHSETRVPVVGRTTLFDLDLLSPRVYRKNLHQSKRCAFYGCSGVISLFPKRVHALYNPSRPASFTSLWPCMQVPRDTGVWGVPIVSFDVWFTCYLEALQPPSETCVCQKILFLICVPNPKVRISAQKRSSLLHRKPYVNSFVDIPSDGGMLHAYQKSDIPWQKNPCLVHACPGHMDF